MRILFIILLLSPSIFFAQERLVINDNAFINIDNSAYLVIDNGNANAITTMGAGGNIISEDETDLIKWNISNTTGTYTIPWTTNSGVKIPQSLDITTAGSSGGSILFSTYETATDMNAPYPSAVINMNFNAIDKSLYVIDRFWHVDARSFGTWPSGDMELHYDPAVNEMGASNTINEANLQAQRFNTALGHWESYILLGGVDVANDKVSRIPFSAAEFFQDWILVDNTNPLPVTLTEFEVECNQNLIEISWTTTTEINNDYFVIEKSFDANTFFELATVQGAGNSNSTINYSITDDSYNGTVYYRLKQVDFNGATTYYHIKTVNCNNSSISIYPNPANEKITINTKNFNNAYVEIYNSIGKLVFRKELKSELTELQTAELSQGMYMLSLIIQGKLVTHEKLIIRH